MEQELTESQRRRQQRREKRQKGLQRVRAANRAQDLRDYLAAHPARPGTLGAAIQ